MHIIPNKLAVGLLFSVALTASAVTPNIARHHTIEADRWADSVYSTLTPRQRIAQLIFPKATPDQGQASLATTTRLIGKHGFGGILYTQGSLSDHLSINRHAKSVASIPPLITFDGEWGLAMRIPDSPAFPQNMTLGAITDYRLIYQYGREMARQCRLAGIDVNFAPVADVNSNPSNPVIGFRSFGEDPSRVACAATAYSLGLEDGGVQAVAKHFPGHGDTDTDSHKTLPYVNHTTSRLDSTDLVPFKDYINAGCSGIMVGHLAVPAIDSTGTPASLSPAITTGLLRNRLGFEGLIYTDALGMKGADHGHTNASVEALKAGADVLLSPLDPVADISAIENAVKTGEIPPSVIEQRCKRILRYKYLLHVSDSISSDNDSIAKAINSPQAEALADRLARAAITVIKNSESILPLNSTDISVVTIGSHSSATFTDICSHYADISSKNPQATVAAIFSDSHAARASLEKLTSSHTDIIAVFFINPYKIAKFSAILPKCKAIVIAYDNITPLQRAAAQAIFGGHKISGRLPVDIAGVAKTGSGIDIKKTRLGYTHPLNQNVAPWITDSINQLINDLIRSGGMPGCQVLVARNGDILIDKAYGKLSSKSTAKVNRTTIYDLASVSKAVGTLPGIMKAYDNELFNLDDHIGRYIPQLNDSAKKNITIRQLLYHESGMPASLNMFDIMFDPATFSGKLIRPRRDALHTIKIQNRAWGHNTARIRKDILSSTPTHEFPIEAALGIFTGPETFDTLMHRIYDIPVRSSRKYNYSCLNFCLLMDIEQKLTGETHDSFVHKNIFSPLGAYRTGYRPRTWTDQANIAPTENDTFLRRQTLHGFVHDELAAFSGGVQGNAGLFANAGDIAKYCQMLLNGGHYGGTRILSPSTVNLFISDKSPTCRRGLGFDKPDTSDLDNSPTCDEASPEVFGHLGFTGTVFWVDPAHDLIFVFLTNRLHPTRDSAIFNRSYIRSRLFSLIYRSIRQ